MGQRPLIFDKLTEKEADRFVNNDLLFVRKFTKTSNIHEFVKY